MICTLLLALQAAPSAPTLLSSARSWTTAAASTSACERTAALAARASFEGLEEDRLLGLANCINLSSPAERAACLAETEAAYREGLELIHAQYDARLELCEKLGELSYDPTIDPAQFTIQIDNPYMPWIPGHTWTYEAQTKDGLEVIFIEVLDETLEIAGVECRLVRDTVRVDGELVEDTVDYYAQDAEGNVWYFGEISQNFEDGLLTDLDGSWKTGVDYAKPGVVMWARPVVGTTYRQEYLIAEAEDAATVLATDAVVAAGGVTYRDCVQTEDFTPLAPEPDTLEHKFFAPGIGFVFELKVESGETLELVSFTTR